MRSVRPNPDTVQNIQSEMQSYWHKDLSGYLYFFKNRYWYIKKKNKVQKKRDMLAYLLGKSWTNVAQTRTLNHFLVRKIRKPYKIAGAMGRNTWLVKIGQLYSEHDLTIRDLDAAVAAELVFSMWIRRRDTHSYNRVYAEETATPVFFDHQTAFLGEEHLKDIGVFFDQGILKDGHAGTWRVREHDGQAITTQIVRAYETEKRPLTIHFVNNIPNCRQHIDRIVHHTVHQSWDLNQMIRKAGFAYDERQKIHAFLLNNLNNLKNHAEVMKNIVFN